MSVTYDDWREACEDLETWALTFLRDPRNEPAKEQLRRACRRAAALRKQEAAARDFEDARPGEAPPEHEPELTEPATPPVEQARLPYPKD